MIFSSVHAKILQMSRCGGMADTRDLKSLGSDAVPVQVRSAAPKPWTLRVQGFRLCSPWPKSPSSWNLRFQELLRVCNFLADAFLCPLFLRLPLYFRLFYLQHVVNQAHNICQHPAYGDGPPYTRYAHRARQDIGQRHSGAQRYRRQHH